jgi:hypothetical protein
MNIYAATVKVLKKRKNKVKLNFNVMDEKKFMIKIYYE